VAIRAKIQQAIIDMPEHDEIKRLLGSSCMNIDFNWILINYLFDRFGLFLLSENC
jgi:hypothetical protein